MGMTETAIVKAKIFCLCGFCTVGVLLVSLSLWDGVMMRFLTAHPQTSYQNGEC